jgi:hypothetical protein
MASSFFSHEKAHQQSLGLKPVGIIFPQPAFISDGQDWQSIPLSKNQTAYTCEGCDELRIFNLDSQETVVAKDPGFKKILSLLSAPTANGVRLVVVCPDKMYLWCEGNGFAFSLPQQSRTRTAISPDGSCVATLSQDGKEILLEAIHLQSLDHIAVSAGQLTAPQEKQLHGDVNEFSLALTDRHVFVSSQSDKPFSGVYEVHASDIVFSPTLTKAFAEINKRGKVMGAWESSQGNLVVAIQQSQDTLAFYEMQNDKFTPVSTVSAACEKIQSVQPGILLLQDASQKQKYLMNLATFETAAIPQEVQFSADGFAFDMVKRKMFELHAQAEMQSGIKKKM